MSTTITALTPQASPIYQAVQYGEPTTSSSIDSSDPLSAGLTPDALMAYCKAHLDSIEGQVRSSFDSQQRGADDVARINKVLADLKDAPPNGTDGSFDRCAQLETSLGSAISDLQKSDPQCTALPGLIQTYNNMVWSGTGGTLDGKSFPGPSFIDPSDYPPDRSQGSQGDKNLSGPELQGYAQTVQDAASSINSQLELQLIQLQSLMSQRQTAISLTTNLVQSLGDQQTKIADNIGH